VKKVSQADSNASFTGSKKFKPIGHLDKRSFLFGESEKCRIRLSESLASSRLWSGKIIIYMLPTFAQPLYQDDPFKGIT
jgi:hypothetical protein